jgi:hypothetical protein
MIANRPPHLDPAGYGDVDQKEPYGGQIGHAGATTVRRRRFSSTISCSSFDKVRSAPGATARNAGGIWNTATARIGGGVRLWTTWVSPVPMVCQPVPFSICYCHSKVRPTGLLA